MQGHPLGYFFVPRFFGIVEAVVDVWALNPVAPVDLALKLLKRTTTYQEVSCERDRGGNTWLYFGIIGYVRGVRVKVSLRKQEKNTNP